MSATSSLRWRRLARAPRQARVTLLCFVPVRTATPPCTRQTLQGRPNDRSMVGANRQRRLPSTIGRPRPRHRSDYDLSYHLGRCFEVCLPRPIPHSGQLTHCVCRSRALGRGLYASSAAADRGREAAEQRHGLRREQSRNGRPACVVSGGSLSPGVVSLAHRSRGCRPGRIYHPTAGRFWALTPKKAMAAHSRTLSRLSHRACVSCACVLRRVTLCECPTGERLGQ